ncbi:hypothetical protein [Methylophaga sp.]|uniref:hypothetical protein n=1 Tax=Methylophaga sp. TaxID=2024840 RepID=UPI003A933F9C
MTIPSEIEFDEALRSLENSTAIELIEKYWKLPDKDMTPSSITELRESLEEKITRNGLTRQTYREYLSYATFKLTQEKEQLMELIQTHDENLINKSKKVLKQPAIDWLMSQPAYKAAMKSISGKLVDVGSEKHINNRLNDLLQAKDNRTLESIVLRLLETQIGTFEYGLLSKLKIYFYSDFESYLDALKKREKIARKTKKNLDELLKIEKVLFELQSIDTRVDSRFFKVGQTNKIKNLLERVSLELEDIANQTVPRLKPIKKGDLTSKERLLIYNLWITLKQSFGSKKNFVNTISHLMYLEGIDNPIGQRALEKLIQGWNGRRQEIINDDLMYENNKEREILKSKYPVFLR